jgi:protein phosphatase
MYDITREEAFARERRTCFVEKIAVISDIHGNLPALEAVFADINSRGINRIICLGDLIGKGPSPAQTIDQIRQASERVIQGNWDLGITYKQDKEAGIWQQNKIGKRRLAYLAKLPFSIDLPLSGKLIRLFHASSKSVFHRVKRKASKDERLALFENTPAIGVSSESKRPDIVGYGDIHVPYLLTLKNPWDKPSTHSSGTGKLLFNVGSVGVPYDGIPQSSYTILEGLAGGEDSSSLSIQFVRVPYDIEKSIHQALKANMPESDRYIVEIRSGLVHK